MRSSEARSPSAAVTGSPGATRSSRNVAVSRSSSKGAVSSQAGQEVAPQAPNFTVRLSQPQPVFSKSQNRKIWMGSSTTPLIEALVAANWGVENSGM